MATSKIIQVLLRILPDKQSAVETGVSLDALSDNLKQVQADIASLSPIANKAIQDLNKQFSEGKLSVEAYENAVNQLASSLTDMPAPGLGSMGPVGQAGAGISGQGGGRGPNSGNALTRLGYEIRYLPAVQIPGTSLSTDAAGKLVQVVGLLPKLGEGLGKAATALQGVNGVIGIVANLGAAVGGVFGGIAVSLGAVLAVALPVVAAVAGIIAVLKGLTDGAERAKKEVQEYVEAAEKRIEIEREISNFTKEGDLSGAEERLRQLRDQQTDANTLLTDLYQQLQDVQEEYAALGAAFKPQERSDLGARGAEIQAQIDRIYKESYLPATTAADMLEEAIPDIAAGVGRVTPTVEELNAAADQVAKSLETIAQLEEQRAQAILKFQDRQTEIDEDRRTRDLREEEDHDRDLTKEKTKLHGDLEKIETEGAERQVQIRNQGLKRLQKADLDITKTGLKIIDLVGDTIKQIDKLNAQYMKDSLKDVQEFHKKEAEIESDNQVERLRILEDLQDQLLTAQLNNDIIAFIAAQKEADKKLGRLEEDSDREAQLRQEDFQERQREREEERQARIAEIQERANERRAELELELAERKAAREELRQEIVNQLDENLQRIAAEKKAASDAFEARRKEADEERKIRLDRQKEDDETADRRREKSLRDQLADIDAKINAEKAGILAIQQQFQGAINNIGSFLNTTVGSALTSLASQLRAAATMNYGGSGLNGGTYGTMYNSGNFGSGYTPSGGTSRPPTIRTGRPLYAFAGGGIATGGNPIFGRFGDGDPSEAEAFIPFNKAEGIGPALRRLGLTGGSTEEGDKFEFNFGDITLNEGVTQEQFEETMNKVIDGTVKGIKIARRPK